MCPGSRCSTSSVSSFSPIISRQLAGVSLTHVYDIKDAVEGCGRDGLALKEHAGLGCQRDDTRTGGPDSGDDSQAPHYSHVQASQRLLWTRGPARTALVRRVWGRGSSITPTGWPTARRWIGRRVAERGRTSIPSS